MTTPPESASQSDRSLWAKLHDAEPLLKAVVKEKVMEPRSDLLVQGELPKAAHLLLEGYTYRYKLMSDGRRQITAVLMPGDVCDLEAVLRGRADYGVEALTYCVVGEMPIDQIADPKKMESEMCHALWRRLLRDQAISREWLVGMGCRDAMERVAHLLCELRVRLEAVGMESGDAFPMKFTQRQLGDIVGLSTVHINRVLQKLRSTGLIEVSVSRMSVIDVAALELLAGFDASYLRLA